MAAFPTSREDLASQDRADPLAHTRNRFHLPAGAIYLDGNSLGAAPRAVDPKLGDAVARQWREDLIRSWNTNDWINAPTRVGAKIAPLIGAGADEVVVADSTSVNLFKLVCGAVTARPGRRVILTEPGNFPTDLYVLQGVARLLGDRVELRVRPREALPAAIDDETALVALTHVHYKSAERWPMAEMTALAHDKGALMLWDLSHSAGALAIDLNGAGADLAVGCGYKYLNGGPGAPSFVFVRRDLHDQIVNPLSGWMGHDSPFDFVDDYRPAQGIRGQLCGTPAILGLVALESGVETFQGLDMRAVEAKGLELGSLFIALVEARCAGFDLKLASPSDPKRRGSHVSFTHIDGYAIMQALIARGVIGDFRAPDIMRFGFTPLYLTRTDVWDAVEALRDILATAEFKQARFRLRSAVT